MGTILVATFGLIVWLVLWAQGIKGFDAFLITAFLLILAVIGRLIRPLIPGLRDKD